MGVRNAVLLGLLCVTGCAGLSHEPPVSLAQTMAGGPPEQQPQSPNSLPLGSQVNAPFTSSIGTISTRVGPASGSAPVTSAKQPLVGTGTATAPATPRSLQNSY
jgi:hypothetical protein